MEGGTTALVRGSLPHHEFTPYGGKRSKTAVTLSAVPTFLVGTKSLPEADLRLRRMSLWLRRVL